MKLQVLYKTRTTL